MLFIVHDLSEILNIFPWMVQSIPYTFCIIKFKFSLETRQTEVRESFYDGIHYAG